jgi:hypothetical protein
VFIAGLLGRLDADRKAGLEVEPFPHIGGIAQNWMLSFFRYFARSDILRFIGRLAEMATVAQPRVKTNRVDPRLQEIADIIESHMTAEGLSEDEKNAKVDLFASLVDSEISKSGPSATHS